MVVSTSQSTEIYGHITGLHHTPAYGHITGLHHTPAYGHTTGAIMASIALLLYIFKTELAATMNATQPLKQRIRRNKGASPSKQFQKNNYTGRHDHLDRSIDYIQRVPDADMRAQKLIVDGYLQTAEFQERRSAITGSKPSRGILVNAGGDKYLTSLIVTLKVIREQFNCTLPVEIAWDSEKDLDKETISVLNRVFGPVYSLYLGQLPYPAHQRRVDPSSYSAKVYSLLFTRFKEVLFLDADATPLLDPTMLFDEPQYQEAGNLFWPDAWDNWIKPGVWGAVGLDIKKAEEAVSRGKGFVQRDCESGMFLMDRARHADVIEYLWWINSFSEKLYDKYIHGDKDTFALAFAVAGKASLYRQMSIPPGGLWITGKGKVLWKASKKVTDGWELVGFLQYNSRAQAAFMHRTIFKFSINEEPKKIDLMSGPLPSWWARYYVAKDSVGPTGGAGNVHAFPDMAVQKITAPTLVTMRHWQNDTLLQEHVKILGDTTCPIAPLSQYLLMIKLALPVELPIGILQACTKELWTFFGRKEIISRRSLKAPENAGELLILARKVEELRMHFMTKEYQQRNTESEFNGTITLPMLVFTDVAESKQLDAIRSTYNALAWLKDHAVVFPVLSKGE